jgi:hypothetical protein
MRRAALMAAMVLSGCAVVPSTPSEIPIGGVRAPISSIG